MALRAQYRGFVYKTPDFDTSALKIDKYLTQRYRRQDSFSPSNASPQPSPYKAAPNPGRLSPICVIPGASRCRHQGTARG